MTMVTDGEFVPVPVRTELLPTVLRLLADHEDLLAARNQQVDEATQHRASTGARSQSPERGAGGSRENPGRVWSQEEYERLVNENTVSADRVRRIMDAMVIHGAPRDRVSTSQLAAETKLKDTQIRAALSWLTRFMRANSDQFENDLWPFGWAVGRQVDPSNPNEFHYEMTQEQAIRWLMHTAHNPAPESMLNDTDERGEEDPQP